jgi:tetratricopeptide (TPR) repeat protein
MQGSTVLEGELAQAFNKAIQQEVSGNIAEAKDLYEEILHEVPDFIYGWSNLGNVLTAEGNLQEALLCYKKALSLGPPKSTLPVILLNKGAIEMNLGQNDQAINDFTIGEKIVSKFDTFSALTGNNNNPIYQQFLINHAIALTRIQQYQESLPLFEIALDVASTNTEKNYAQSWWLRYAMVFIETNQIQSAYNLLQRILQRYPTEPECNAFATVVSILKQQSLETTESIWQKLSVNDQEKYSSINFLREKLYWGEKSIATLQSFLQNRSTKS